MRDDPSGIMEKKERTKKKRQLAALVSLTNDYPRKCTGKCIHLFFILQLKLSTSGCIK